MVCLVPHPSSGKDEGRAFRAVSSAERVGRVGSSGRARFRSTRKVLTRSSDDSKVEVGVDMIRSYSLSTGNTELTANELVVANYRRSEIHLTVQEVCTMGQSCSTCRNACESFDSGK